MLSSTQNIAPKPALPPAAQPPAPPSPASGPSFAQFLTEQASPPAPQSGAPEQPEAPADTAQPPSSASARRAAQPPKPAAPQRTPDAAPKGDAKAAADPAEARAAGDTETAATDEDDASQPPELKEFTQLLGLAAGQPDPTAAARPELHRGRGAAPSGDDMAPARGAARAGAADTDRAAEAPATAHAKAAEARADKADARAAASELLQAAATEGQATAVHATATPDAAAASSFAAALAQALPAPAAPAASAPPAAEAAVQAPLHSPAFAPELGARVSLLAVDGVQQAELQLNPTDMGPVNVQITVDGNQAQVSFHAVQAETRQALEQSLPDLAAALQGQGLTLSGGGVFQQAPRDADHDRQAPETGSADRGIRGTASRAGATAAPARRTVGLLDTFA